MRSAVLGGWGGLLLWLVRFLLSLWCMKQMIALGFLCSLVCSSGLVTCRKAAEFCFQQWFWHLLADRICLWICLCSHWCCENLGTVQCCKCFSWPLNGLWNFVSGDVQLQSCVATSVSFLSTVRFWSSSYGGALALKGTGARCYPTNELDVDGAERLGWATGVRVATSWGGFAMQFATCLFHTS